MSANEFFAIYTIGGIVASLASKYNKILANIPNPSLGAVIFYFYFVTYILVRINNDYFSNNMHEVT